MELSQPIDRLVLAVDTSDIQRAAELAEMWADIGGTKLKLGLELEKASSHILGDPLHAQSVHVDRETRKRDLDPSYEMVPWPGVPEWAMRLGGGTYFLSRLASEYGLDWVYDGKIKDIGATMGKTIPNILDLKHPPIAITMHADTSFAGMQRAQREAGEVPMLGVTLLTDISPAEAIKTYGTEQEKKASLTMNEEEFRQLGESIRIREVTQRGDKLADAGVLGFVASPGEVGILDQNKKTSTQIKMIPGGRSPGADSDDQENVNSHEHIFANGAQLGVIGREVTNSDDPVDTIKIIVSGVARGLAKRTA